MVKTFHKRMQKHKAKQAVPKANFWESPQIGGAGVGGVTPFRLVEPARCKACFQDAIRMAALSSLAPGFSPVCEAARRRSRFNGFFRASGSR